MIFARAMAAACLTAFKALLWLTGGLLLLLTVVQHLRGDVDARPLLTMGFGVASVGLGFACGFGASWFQNAGVRR